MRTSPALLLLGALCLCAVPALRADPQYPKMGPDIYDIHADASAQISDALARASAEHKRVILDFGANWCIWCRRLHSTFEADPAVSAALARDFVVVLVDVNSRGKPPRNAEVNARYGNPIQFGLPVLVVLDTDGKYLVTKDSGELEEGDHHSPAKILAFLKAWTPARH